MSFSCKGSHAQAHDGAEGQSQYAHGTGTCCHTGRMINREIRAAKNKKSASITLKMNSLSDEELIDTLYEAARAGVKLKMIIRGIYCMISDRKDFKPVTAISIIDEYLEHARIFVFYNGGKEKVYISSADWMVRNLDHRVEANSLVFDEGIKQELKNILNIQLSDIMKARVLDNDLNNHYVKNNSVKKVRSQIDTYNYLMSLNIKNKKQEPDLKTTPEEIVHTNTTT